LSGYSRTKFYPFIGFTWVTFGLKSIINDAAQYIKLPEESG
jgi:hypothetical protein